MGHFSKAAMIEYNVTALFFSREMCVIAYAWDRLLHRGNITIECKSIHPGDQEVLVNKIDVPKESSTRIEISMMTFELYPRLDRWVDMVLLTNADPKLWFAPSVLINFIFKQVVGKFIDKILKFSETVHEKEWGKRMEQNKDFYEWLKTFGASYLETLAAKDTKGSTFKSDHDQVKGLEMHLGH